MPHIFHLIPHTHWDREWYLTAPAFLARLIPTVDDLLTHLEQEPTAEQESESRSFVLDGQTVLVEDYLRVRPDAAARVASLVRAGRLQIGPWYVLADELIPSGESLIRNLLLGACDAARLGGRMNVVYSPDAFGHPAVLPALGAEFGMRWGVLWRGLGGEPGQHRDLYRWRAPDGREMLVYHLPPDGYEIGAALPADGDRLAARWAAVRDVLVGRAATRHVAVFVGADHHAAHPSLGALRRQLTALAPADEFRVSRLEEFFQAVENEADALPRLDGELRWSYRYTWTLQGVHATRAPLKRYHAETELRLARIAEPLAALATWHDGVDRRALLEHTWRTLVRSQFHDSIGGCTSDAVARQVERRLASAGALANEIARASSDALLGHDFDAVREHPDIAAPALALWNPAPRPRGGVVIADVTAFRRDVLIGPPGDRIARRGPGRQPMALRGPHGLMPVQVLGRWRGRERLDARYHYPDQDEVDVTRIAFRAPEVDGFGLAAIYPESGVTDGDGDAWARGRRIGNDLVEAAVDRSGALRMVDRRTGHRYAGIGRLESGGDIGDTYTYCPPGSDRVVRSRGPARVRCLAAGPLVAALEVTQRFAGVTIRSVVSVHAGSPAVRCTLELDNSASDARLRLLVPTGATPAIGASTIAGAQFGAIARSPIVVDPADYPRERPVPTAPAQRFVAHGAPGRAVAVLAPGFFEYESAENGDLAITLLRSVGSLSRGSLATRPGHAGWPTVTPLAQCHGIDRLQFAFCPLSGIATPIARLEALWEELFVPVQARWLRQASPLRLASTRIALIGDTLVFSGLKPHGSGTGLVLRCYNPEMSSITGGWRFGRPVSTAYRVHADEQSSRESVEIADGGHLVRFTAGPAAIVTIVIE